MGNSVQELYRLSNSNKFRFSVTALFKFQFSSGFILNNRNHNSAHYTGLMCFTVVRRAMNLT